MTITQPLCTRLIWKHKYMCISIVDTVVNIVDDLIKVLSWRVMAAVASLYGWRQVEAACRQPIAYLVSSCQVACDKCPLLTRQLTRLLL